MRALHPAVWNMPAVMRMLNSLGLSYKDPIALSDFLTTCDFVQGEEKPRRVSVSRGHTCLPCPDAQGLCPCRLGEHNITQTECITGGGVSFYGGAGAWRDGFALSTRSRDAARVLPALVHPASQHTFIRHIQDVARKDQARTNQSTSSSFLIGAALLTVLRKMGKQGMCAVRYAPGTQAWC